MNKVLITGAHGQLAHDLISVFSKDKKYRVIKSTRNDFDITKKRQVQKFINYHKPNIIVNTIAFHKTNECEIKPEQSFDVNALGAYYLACAASKHNARVIYISTDYVFDNSEKIHYEDHLPSPLNVYGASKIAGENLNRIGSLGNFLNIRTGWLYGKYQSGKGHDFVRLMLTKAKANEQIKVVNDQFGSPTSTADLSAKIKELIDKKVPSGTYHLTNSGTTNWYLYTKEIFRLKKIQAKLLSISSNEFSSLVKRPQFSTIKSKQLAKLKIKPMQHWKKALNQFLGSNTL